MPDLRAGLAQLGGQRQHVRLADVAQRHLAAGDDGADGEGAGLEPVGQDRLGDAVQAVDAVDDDRRRAEPADAGAHPVQHVAEARRSPARRRR